MVRIKRKYESGTATAYIPRNQAIKKLQLSLKDFRRLCIIKGIYPHEPKHKKKVNKGSTENKTYYYAKDIQFLAHEPIIWKFRENKIFLRRLTKAKAYRDKERIERATENKPTFRLDHIVKERYPSFPDAVRDLDDALCLIFVFARFPTVRRSKGVKPATVNLCRKLAIEFMHYIIEKRALRKVFISIKGIYYQAELLGETVTWIVPHERALSPVSDVDFAIMSTFVEFYTTMIAFVNFKLYNDLGLFYPPKLSVASAQKDLEDYALDPDAENERIYSLAVSLSTNKDEKEIVESTIDEFNDVETDTRFEQAKAEQRRLEKLQNLFKGCKIFLSREVPRESLVFIIRSSGGEVSWAPESGYGSTFSEGDETITHQVVDRPNINNANISRKYVQPQWVYDCVNNVELLASTNYLPGCILPPHLSPFVEHKPGDYVPPEARQQIDEPVVEPETPVVKKKKVDSGEKVRPGAIRKTHPEVLKGQDVESKKLQEIMIPKKQRRVYHKIQKGIKSKQKQVKKLHEKRKSIDAGKPN